MWQLIVAVVVLCFVYVKSIYSYWEKRGLDTPTFHYFVGNLLEQFLFKKNSAVIMEDGYKSFEGYNYFGFYNAMQPAIVVRNPEIINDILIKDFVSFCDNDFDIDEVADPAFGKNPFILKGQKWKKARAQATPSFTSGKMKMMMPLIKETCEKLQKYLSENQSIPIELFPLANKITSENVASCAFGLEGHSFSKRNADFLEIVDQLIKPNTWNVLKGFMIFLCPPLARLIKVRFFQVDTLNYLRNIIEETLHYRQEHNIERNDFLDEMKRLKDKINDERDFNFTDILGHSGGFLLDGILTSSSVIAYLIYTVANNQEVQEKLREEIQGVLKDNNDVLTYDNINEMEYLECVFKETLRQHPPLMYMTRRVTRSYTMRPTKEDNTGPCVRLEVGTPIIIPTYALHRDGRYFPEPDKFDPSRWKRENKENIVRNTYLPFGDGPRICLGLKFGMLQSKMTLITILSNYVLTVNDKTKKIVEVDPQSFLNLPVGGHWVDFTKL